MGHLADVRDHCSECKQPFVQLPPPIPLRHNVLRRRRRRCSVRRARIIVPRKRLVQSPAAKSQNLCNYHNSTQRERERERGIPAIKLFSLKEHFGLPIVFVLFNVVVLFTNVVHGFSFCCCGEERERERERERRIFLFLFLLLL